MSLVWSPIFTPPVEFHQSASVCIERTFEVPQAAAGPLVTPTKPILRTLLAASAGTAAEGRAAIDARPMRAARNEAARYPIFKSSECGRRARPGRGAGPEPSRGQDQVASRQKTCQRKERRLSTIRQHLCTSTKDRHRLTLSASIRGRCRPNDCHSKSRAERYAPARRKKERAKWRSP